MKGFHSIENIFKSIANSNGDIYTNSIILPLKSSNPFFILLNLLWLLQYRKGIFHITGHVHYAALVLPINRTVLTIHDLGLLYQYKGWKRIMMKWLFLDWPLRRIKCITTVSEKTKTEILKYSKFPSENIFVIPNPVQSEIRYQPKQFNVEKPIILFIGTKLNKNLDRAIEALNGLKVHLRIIGKLNKAHLNILSTNNIEYSNAVCLSNENLANEYVKADMVLFPSTYEGFGLPIIESFEAGRPIITSHLEPMNIIAEDAAYLVDPHNTINIRESVLQVIEDERLRIEKVAKGLEIAKKYSVGAIRKQYVQIWRNLDSSFE
jgi:glycosyltransferase involved in cell wall biosynthesis